MIEVKDLRKVFDNGFEALKQVTFSIEKGDLVCLLGPSGCGKTTILNLIAGLLDPTDGTIHNERVSMVDKHPKDRDIGFVFQNYALYPHMTVLENVMFPLRVGDKKMPKEEAEKIARKYMALTDIEELANKKPGTMSGGQQQRVAITRALVQNPSILLLDEPLSNLDARLRLKIREEIRRLVKEINITTIFVTHDQEEALSISDKIVLMNEGVIQQYDDPQNLYLEPNNLFVAQFIGNPVINILPVEVKNGTIMGETFEFNKSSLVQDRIKTDLTDGTYLLGVRPEDIIFSEQGIFNTEIETVELIGREGILNFKIGSKNAKGIVSIESLIDPATIVNCDFNYPRIFMFKESGERVY
ncbi:ABC transporter ATP-binding protein [Erysipelothrix enhydrae]|uniref:ABC transporter ATP-binding protein n=1 Tax=Erysipelothrix enhydrae TaxID=2890314 RepID=UPI002B24E15D|nr:ABC transporter ATP-binding protein [Erysipelothrix sp. 4322-04]WRB86417.1 ABC transporter ATP-binding protein [Erysipelothrix sp. 4322-04]